jgi:hypothetical protein
VTSGSTFAAGAGGSGHANASVSSHAMAATGTLIALLAEFVAT